MASYILGPVWGFKRNPRYSLFPEVLHTNRFVKYSVCLSYDFIGSTTHTEKLGQYSENKFLMTRG